MAADNPVLQCKRRGRERSFDPGIRRAHTTPACEFRSSRLCALTRPRLRPYHNQLKAISRSDGCGHVRIQVLPLLCQDRGPIHYHVALSVLALPISFEKGSQCLNSELPAAAFFRDFLLSLCPVLLSAALGLAFAAHACTDPAAAAPAPDVIFFTNGDQLTGKLLREVGGSVTFHSDMAGDVTVTWDKIKSIHTSQQFAVIQQGQHVTRKTADADVAQGSVQVEDDQVKVTPAPGARAKTFL
jgi:hypothetical protein